MHAKMLKNRDKLNEQFRNKLNDSKTRINVLQVREDRNNNSKIVLPRIRDQIGLQKFDGEYTSLFVVILGLLQDRCF